MSDFSMLFDSISINQNDTPPNINPSILFHPVKQGQKIKCKIKRYKADVKEKMFPVYELFFQQDYPNEDDHQDQNNLPQNHLVFAMAARKRKKSKTSHLIITSSRFNDKLNKSKEDHDIIAHVRANFLGTGYTITSNEGVPNEHAAIIYETNLLGFKGPRKMTVVIPTMKHDNEANTIVSTNNSDSILLMFQVNPTHQNLVELHNKIPQWNEETESFVLNFDNRVTIASVKNFQIVHDDDLEYIIMQFGRIANDEFTMDIQYPLSPIQAFGIALSSFDPKLACE